MIAIGVDPGVSGSLVALMPDGEVLWWDCPSDKPEGQKFRQHNRKQMNQIILSLSKKDRIIAVVEEVHFDTRDDAHRKSAETLIRTAECWLTLLESQNAEVYELLPVEWRSKLGLEKGLDKSGYVEAAIKMYPQCRSWIRYQWRNKMTEKDGRAEALLMAHLALQISEEGLLAS